MLGALLCLSPSPQLPPALVPLPPASVHLDGWLGARVAANRTAWLDRCDLTARLEPFVHRPAKQAWMGEHLGKWLCAASAAAAESGDPVLRERLGTAVPAFLTTQEPDGYLGAYLPPQRFQLLPDADWDVWTVEYSLLGLLAVHTATGDAAALAGARRAADLLLATFPPGGRSLVTAGTHVGMAATSVLEPIVQLFEATRDERYLAFARRIVAAWDGPGGPRIAASLREHGRVARTANGKAYEMLSNLVGLCALARATGDRDLLEPVLAAWRDVVANELLVTGSASVHEHFTGGGRLPAGPQANLGETCVTVTWLQLNLALLQLLGETRFADEFERAACNHLAGAQRPDGGAWCYYTPLRGTKPYDDAITCCSSSGPRGMALLPRAAAFVAADGALVLNLLDAAHGEATLGGKRVTFAVASGLPRTGEVAVTFGGELPAVFGVRLRVPAWGAPATLTVGGTERRIGAAGWLDLPPRSWSPGDRIGLALRCGATVLRDAHDPARLALQWGPCVLAAPLPAGTPPRLEPDPATAALLPGPELRVRCGLRGGGSVDLVPFADVGRDGGGYRVWLAAAVPGGIVPGGEARSRAGNVDGSLRNGDRDGFVVTYDGTRAAEDWYSVALPAVAPVRWVAFSHGHCFHDGGWFDTSRGKPLVQVRAAASGEWRTIGELADYPATTAEVRPGLADGQRFVLSLAAPADALEVRVVGVPACGDGPGQAFSSCAELEVGG